jgi:hypothetical protein
MGDSAAVATALLARGNEMLDSRRITGRSVARGLPQRVGRWLSVDVRWLGIGAALVLALLAGVMLEMVLADHSRLTLVWFAALAAVLAGAIGCVAMTAVRDADLLWDVRKDAAIARGDAELAERRADSCRADDLRSRELLQRLQVATTDAMRDPFLADRLARGPRDEQDLLSLLDQVDRHLGQLPATPGSWARKPNARNP